MIVFNIGIYMCEYTCVKRKKLKQVKETRRKDIDNLTNYANLCSRTEVRLQ